MKKRAKGSSYNGRGVEFILITINPKHPILTKFSTFIKLIYFIRNKC